MPRTDLLTLGESFEDLVFSGLPRLPRPGEEIKTSTFLKTVGGGALITGVAAARLGLRVRVLSGTGPDAAVRLRQEGVSVVNLRRAGEPHAITAALSTGSNRSFVTFNGVNDVLEERLARALPRERARHVHFAFFPRDCRNWTAIVEACRARVISTSWDFGWNEGLLGDRAFPTLLRALDYTFFNEQEMLLYARRRDSRRALSVWRRHPRTIVLKLGARGSRLLAPGLDVSVRAPRVTAVDTTGAGDAFNGGFLYALLRGRAARDCLTAGNFVGAMSARAAGGLDALPRARDLPPSLRRGGLARRGRE